MSKHIYAQRRVIVPEELFSCIWLCTPKHFCLRYSYGLVLPLNIMQRRSRSDPEILEALGEF